MTEEELQLWTWNCDPIANTATEISRLPPLSHASVHTNAPSAQTASTPRSTMSAPTAAAVSCRGPFARQPSGGPDFPSHLGHLQPSACIYPTASTTSPLTRGESRISRPRIGNITTKNTRPLIGWRPLSSLLTRRLGLDRERVHPRLELGGERLVHHPMTFDQRLADERLSHDIYSEMALALRVSPGMAGMERRFIDDGEMLRGERLPELA